MSPHPFVQRHDPEQPGCACADCTTRQRASLAGALIVAVLAVLIVAGIARGATPKAAPAPVALLKARAACPVGKPLECRAALRRALEAVAWQKKERLKRERPFGVQHALRLASAVYGVPLAEMRRVGTCESHLQPLAKNAHSSAAGLFQFLDSTWARAGIHGFSVYDPYANALAAARLVQRDGGWREWSCGYRA